MKVLSASQIREADQYTIKHEPIESIDLMERASNAFVEKFFELVPNKRPVHIFCGTGNNGGDGLAIGRILKKTGWEVHLYVIGSIEKGSKDFKINLERTSDYHLLNEENEYPNLSSENVIIDGLFGSGLTRSLEGLPLSLINHLNNQQGLRISIDIASGLFSDKAIEEDSIAFMPNHTISFQCPKLVFFLPEYFKFVGDWHVVDIGLDQSFLETLETEHYFSSSDDLNRLLPKRTRFDHKSKIGNLRVVAGSKGKMGAAALCSKAALRSGVGLIHVHVPKCGVDIIQTLVPEAMVNEDQGEEFISSIESSKSTTALGPGIGTSSETSQALKNYLELEEGPIVIDADGLNIIAENNWLDKLPQQSILTPHPGEFKRLVGEWKDDFEKLGKLSSLCQKFQVNVVLKGAFSAACNTKGEIHFNPTGNPGMATAGSGDVLTGIAGAFLSQGLAPFDALRSAVYIHGLSGDIAAEKLGQLGLIATDIIDNISNAIRS